MTVEGKSVERHWACGGDTQPNASRDISRSVNLHELVLGCGCVQERRLLAHEEQVGDPNLLAQLVAKGDALMRCVFRES